MHILRNILMFLLFLVGGFFSGLFVAMVVDAGKDQMLAGGAIVLGYGVVGALIGIALAIFVLINYRKKVSFVKKLNVTLFVLVLGLWVYFWVQREMREAGKKEQMGLEIKMKVKPLKDSKCL